MPSCRGHWGGQVHLPAEVSGQVHLPAEASGQVHLPAEVSAQVHVGAVRVVEFSFSVIR